MKGSHPVITLLGNNSGKNMGDAAILASIMDSISREIPRVEFLVPTINTRFIEDNYGDRYNVKAVNVLPWTGSIRLLGLPTLRCFLKSDLALICDGIIFDYKLFGIHNFLITLVFLIPLARLLGCKVVCYSCGIGPLNTFFGKLFAKWVINGSDLVMMRERDSIALSREIGVTKQIELTGDAAFLNRVSGPERAEDIARRMGIDLNSPLLGVNVTGYIDSWLKRSEQLRNRSEFVDLLADGINRASGKADPSFTPVIFSTHPMDDEYAVTLSRKTGGAMISNSQYLSHDIQSVMKRCRLLIGMRFHSLVCASATGVPIIGLVYAPKVRGFMELLGCEEFCCELSGITVQSFSDTILKGWNSAEELKRKQAIVIDDLKYRAQEAAFFLSRYYFPVAGDRDDVRLPASGDQKPESVI